MKILTLILFLFATSATASQEYHTLYGKIGNKAQVAKKFCKHYEGMVTPIQNEMLTTLFNNIGWDMYRLLDGANNNIQKLENMDNRINAAIAQCKTTILMNMSQEEFDSWEEFR
jgi:hypothetical protein